MNMLIGIAVAVGLLIALLSSMRRGEAMDRRYDGSKEDSAIAFGNLLGKLIAVLAVGMILYGILTGQLF